jgi:hypothetical protein
MLGDNMSVVEKKHNAITYHHVRETIAAEKICFAYINSEEYSSDIMTKPLSNEKFHYLVKK